MKKQEKKSFFFQVNFILGKKLAAGTKLGGFHVLLESLGVGALDTLAGK